MTDNTGNSATLVVTVTVININEDPQFDAETATVSVDENTPANHNIGSPFKATDEDRVDRLAYDLSGMDAASFGMVDSHSTGAQLRTKVALDHETKDQYSVTILVRDGVDDTGDPNVTADDTINITINVTNVDENGEVTLSNEQPEEEQPITASLEDDDGGVTSLTWQWATSSSRSGSWTDATGTGATSATYTPVTADVNKYLRATASYTDGQGQRQDGPRHCVQPGGPQTAGPTAAGVLAGQRNPPGGGERFHRLQRGTAGYGEGPRRKGIDL